MSNAYHLLLDSLILHLEQLREQGVSHLPVDPVTLDDLTAPSPRKPVAATRTPPKASAPATATATQAARSSLTELAESLRDTPRRAAVSTNPPAGPGQPVRAPGPNSVPTIPYAVPFKTMTRPEKEAAFEELRARVLACQKCEPLVKARTNVVFGVGDVHSPLLFVGEAPGADEDQQGEPFVGAAGQLLTKIIQAMGLSRSTVFIANILKCRPDTPGQTSGNRKPTPMEMATCFPYLQEQVRIIQPKVIVALGATAVEGLFGKTEGISRLRGRWMSYMSVPVMPTYHPAYLLRNQALAEKRKVWEDMLQVMERLSMTISEKQHNFFLRAP
jgi:uracil-DNA glycosylase family 4